jgi:catechol 2,3-dioxygenase-like lactoylglutathione lyase family enzyme
MQVVAIAGFAVITRDPEPSKTLYRDTMKLPLNEKDDYLSVDRFKGVNHFGVWTLEKAAQSCFGRPSWPDEYPVPQATIEFELGEVDAVQVAVEEMKANGQEFVHETRVEPWGQTVARFISPEGLLVALSYAPWMHEKSSDGR